VAVDGSKMKAYASPGMFTEGKSIKRLKKIDEQIEEQIQTTCYIPIFSLTQKQKTKKTDNDY
jgi:hypothetical protein